MSWEVFSKGMTKEATERELLVVSLYMEGKTMQEVGDILDPPVSRERVRQILEKQGIGKRRRIFQSNTIIKPFDTKDGKPIRGRIAEFWSLVDKNHPDGCWMWKGTMYSTTVRGKKGNAKYGRYRFRNQEALAQEVAFWLTRGRWPKRFYAKIVECLNMECVNPAHWTEGTTYQEIIERRDARKLLRQVFEEDGATE